MKKIPLYSEDWLHQHQRKRSGVLEKLRKIYGLSQDELGAALMPLDNDLANINMLLYGSELNDRIEQCRLFSDIPLAPSQREKISEICIDLARECSGIFNLRQAMKEKSQEAGESIESRLAVTGRITDIYANHVMMQALVQIKSFGFSDRSAFALTGLVIGKIAGTASARTIKPAKPVRADALNGWFQDILEFTENEKRALNNRSRLQSMSVSVGR